MNMKTVSGKFCPTPFVVKGKLVSFRPAVAEDAELCTQLTQGVMAPYVQKIWPNNDEVMQEYIHRNRLNVDTTVIILCGTNAVGRMAVSETEQAIKLDNMQLLPDLQNKGIGGNLMKQLVAYSQTKKKPLSLLVLENNPAIHLYERCGFSPAGEVRDHRIVMERPFSLKTERGL